MAGRCTLTTRSFDAEFQWRLGLGRGFRSQAEVAAGAIEPTPFALDWFLRELPEEGARVPVGHVAFVERLAEGLVRHEEPVRAWLAGRLRRSLRHASFDSPWLHDFEATLWTECYSRYWQWLEALFKSRYLPAPTRDARRQGIEALFAKVGADGAMSRACAWMCRGHASDEKRLRLPGNTVVNILDPGKPLPPALIRRGIPIDWHGYASGNFPAYMKLLDIRLDGGVRGTCLLVRGDSAWHSRVLHQSSADSRGRLLDAARSACLEFLA